MLAALSASSPTIEIIGEYVSTNTPMDVRCSVCGFEWKSTAQRMLRGHGCRKCSGVAKRVPIGGRQRRKTHDEFVSQVRLIRPDVMIMSEYQNAATYVDCKCANCGNEWRAKPSNILSGFGCSKCGHKSGSSKQVKSNDVFINELSEINSNIEPIGEYTGNKHKLLVRCKICGCEWEAMPINLLRKDGKATGCPSCRASHGEKAICDWMDSHGVDYETQVSFDDLVGVLGRKLSYDFYIPQFNTLVEYQGEFHDNSARIQTSEGFRTQSEHDKRKMMYAEKNGYSVLYIWYYDNIEEILNEWYDSITNPVTTTAS